MLPKVFFLLALCGVCLCGLCANNRLVSTLPTDTPLSLTEVSNPNSALCPGSTGSQSCCSASQFLDIEACYIDLKATIQKYVDAFQLEDADSVADALGEMIQNDDSLAKEVRELYKSYYKYRYSLIGHAAECAEVYLSYLAGLVCLACDPAYDSYSELDSEGKLHYFGDSALKGRLEESCRKYDDKMADFIEDQWDDHIQAHCYQEGLGADACATYKDSKSSDYQTCKSYSYTDALLAGLPGFATSPVTSMFSFFGDHSDAHSQYPCEAGTVEGDYDVYVTFGDGSSAYDLSAAASSSALSVTMRYQTGSIRWSWSWLWYMLYAALGVITIEVGVLAVRHIKK
ncbi:hypothetical protein KIPB_008671 [Kipferlia bialata]|uniref:Uncharacterized protein n=1 Tax=Kipferlia bialata TaxID=797122 RepID=A0A9K3GK29_9EUKA|nr:hypothetical protein KIPB_008671 [Kipferlia bialata]|eukprot:g8671.t1